MKPPTRDRTDEFMKVLHASEYDTQLFDFNPYSIFLGLQQLLFHKLKRGTRKMEKSLLKRCKDADEEIQCKLLVEKLQQLYQTYSGNCFHNLDVFRIPAHMLLPQDQVQRNQYTEEDVKEIEEEFLKLNQRYKRAQCLKYYLQVENTIYEQLYVIEKKVFELENDVNNCSKTTAQINKYNEIRNTVTSDLQELFHQIHKLNIKM